MKNKSKNSILIIGIIDVAAVVFMILLLLTDPKERKYPIEDTIVQKINENRYTMKIIPLINKNGEITDSNEGLLLINVIQMVLEKTLKTNDEIALLAVYLDDGTIISHLKPERIGKNMFDADIELNDYMHDISTAIKNRKIYKGLKYDPLLNENIRFIVKPLQIDNLDHNLSLLIGVHESYMLKESRPIVTVMGTK
jgi:predicted transcriptional regulator